ncbi:hypothetical protein WMY93_024879 [Mugilogobius chulae]|uniref:Uncharacterized protein n=1 Tax=Mugilogobius chulae TaxID=88201 RepID=A0AAW0NCV6_9GOBI
MPSSCKNRVCAVIVSSLAKLYKQSYLTSCRHHFFHSSHSSRSSSSSRPEAQAELKLAHRLLLLLAEYPPILHLDEKINMSDVVADGKSSRRQCTTHMQGCEKAVVAGFTEALVLGVTQWVLSPVEVRTQRL